MLVGRQRQHIAVQRQRPQALQHVVQDVRLLDGRQLGQQLVDVLQRLRQAVQIVLELADGRLPELLLSGAVCRSIAATVVAVVFTVHQIVGHHRIRVGETRRID